MSATSSPLLIGSPSFLCHLTTVPSVMVSESCGMVISTDMYPSLGISDNRLPSRRRRFGRRWAALPLPGCGRRGRGFRRSGRIRSAHRDDRAGLLDFLQDAAAHSAETIIFIHDHAAIGFPDRIDDGLRVQRAQRFADRSAPHRCHDLFPGPRRRGGPRAASAGRS